MELLKKALIRFAILFLYSGLTILNIFSGFLELKNCSYGFAWFDFTDAIVVSGFLLYLIIQEATERN